MKFKVSSLEEGMTLLTFLKEKWKEAPSVKALKRAIDGKRCTINGRVETFSTHRLKAGDVVWIELVPTSSVLKPELLWEDDYLKAYNKPAGVVSAAVSFKGVLIHRLDKETSGVILVGKSAEIVEKMIELFRHKKVKKIYLAIVDGKVREKQGKVVSRLTPIHRFQGQTVYGSASQGEWAETRWKKIKEGKDATLLECYPVTGRTHQIRVHLKERGHPILGDYHYSKQFKSPFKAHRHLLHALEISFPHPITQKPITLSAPLPDDFSEAIKALL